MANTTINGITVYNGSSAVIIENSCTKNGNLTVFPLYLNDSDLTDVFDFGGTVKTINLTGSYTAAATANLKTWIDSIEVLIQGHQDIQAGAPYVFVDDFRGTIKVKVLSFNSTAIPGEPTRVGWTLKLVQSSENA